MPRLRAAVTRFPARANLRSPHFPPRRFSVSTLPVFLTSERPRTRWFVLLFAWAVVALFATLHTLAFRDYLDLLNRAAQRVPPAVTPMQRIVPTNYADVQTWVRYALDFEKGAPWRVRTTQKDNAPQGREVHWNSAFAHGIAAGGKIRAALTGEPLPLATERSLAWLNLPLFLGTVVLFSVWVTRRTGAGAGALVALGMLGYESFYSGFAPGYVDHHGVLTSATFGVVLGAIFMGGGWWRTTDDDTAPLLPASRARARSAAIFSAICGAVGLWFSAASTIPSIALVGAAGLVATWSVGRALRGEGAEFDGGLWRLWAWVGAGTSVGFYLLEYAPHHLGLRMEVNHPFYALAWWGGGELVALLAEHRLHGTGWFPRPASRLIFPLLALAVAPLTIALGGGRVFVVSDPFVAKIPTMVAEGLSLFATQEIFGWRTFFGYINWNFAPFLIAAGLLIRARAALRLPVIFAGLVAVGFAGLMFVQVRWATGASGPLLCLLLVVVAALLQGRSERVRWLAITGVVVLLLLPNAVSRIQLVRHAVTNRSADRMDYQQLLYRDAAAAIRASQPTGEIVLLASPNGSTGMGYYGDFKTIGTLYWENYVGLRAAAEIFSATDDETARHLIRARGITHLAMISEEGFLSQFFSLLHPEKNPDDLKKTFGYALLANQIIPRWLRPIPYRPPADVVIPGLRVILLQVVPDQPDWEAHWHIARAQLALGENDHATQTFVTAVNLAPAAHRAPLLQRAGTTCYQSGAPAAAVVLYRAALNLGDNAATATNLAWLLATTRADAVRNGRDALTYAESALRLQGENPETLSSLAAALAEVGRFPEAVSAASRAVDLVKSTGNAAATKELSARLAAFRAGQPWRQ